MSWNWMGVLKSVMFYSIASPHPIPILCTTELITVELLKADYNTMDNKICILI